MSRQSYSINEQTVTYCRVVTTSDERQLTYTSQGFFKEIGLNLLVDIPNLRNTITRMTRYSFAFRDI